MKVIIAGSRDILDYKLVVQSIQRSGYEITEVVCGCAAGIDTLGEQWAINNEIPIKYMPADWNRHGKSAGPMRNKKMAEYADAAIVIWNGVSPGSKNMIQNMIRQNKPYYIGMSATTLEDFI